MHPKTLQAYKYLSPSDQLVIDAMIATLYKKDKQISTMAREVMEFISDGKEEEDVQEEG